MSVEEKIAANLNKSVNPSMKDGELFFNSVSNYLRHNR